MDETRQRSEGRSTHIRSPALSRQNTTTLRRPLRRMKREARYVNRPAVDEASVAGAWVTGNAVVTPESPHVGN